MPIRNLAELPELMAPNQCLMGIDYGSKHIGLAIADPGFSIASSLAVIERGKLSAVVAELEKHIKNRNVGALIIGLPLTLEGENSAMTQSVRTFASNLDKTIAPNMAFWDERFSTAFIQRELTERADLSRAKRAVAVDKLAAAYILQGALDFLRNSRRQNPQY